MEENKTKNDNTAINPNLITTPDYIIKIGVIKLNEM